MVEASNLRGLKLKALYNNAGWGPPYSVAANSAPKRLWTCKATGMGLEVEGQTNVSCA